MEQEVSFCDVPVDQTNQNQSLEKESLKSEHQTTPEKLDISQACKFFEQACAVSCAPEQFTTDSVQMLPPECVSGVSSVDKATMENYREVGLELISRGEMGVLLLAGGQGTRLGVAYPKGMYDVGLPSHKSLFQIQAERIAKLERLASEKFGRCRPIPWYIMTSEFTTEATRHFFTSNEFFGLDPGQVKFFQQRSLPCFSLTGEVLFEAPGREARAPDGSGGVFHALGSGRVIEEGRTEASEESQGVLGSIEAGGESGGVLAHMRSRGVRHVLVYCVDNVLVKVGDPVFLGYCVAARVQCGVKVIERTCPDEKLGVLCRVHDKFKVVEYSETHHCPLFQARDQEGRLMFNLGNICNHYFSIDFLAAVAAREETLQFHTAHKKIPYMDATGRTVRPESPNGIKLEKFIFDALELCESLVAWNVRREEEFAALKNSSLDGSGDTPATCREAVFRLHREWVEEAGGEVVGGREVEVAPELSYAGEGLEGRVRGRRLQTPLHLEAKSLNLESDPCLEPDNHIQSGLESPPILKSPLND